MKKYHTTHSELTSAEPRHIWSLWSDVTNWPVWDVGISSAVPKDRFEPGHSFMLTPKGAPQPVEVTFTDVKPNVGFSDEAKLPFGTIRTIHHIEKEGEHYRVTQTIEADIDQTIRNFSAGYLVRHGAGNLSIGKQYSQGS